MTLDSRNGKSEREVPTRAEVRSWVAQEIGKLGIDPQDPGDFRASQDKRRGDYFADCAIDALVRAGLEPDTLKAKITTDHAKVYALLAHRDAILESTATLKEVANRQIDTSQQLSAQLRRVA